MKFTFKRSLFLNPYTLILFCIAIMVILFIYGIPIFELMELKSYDLRFRSRGIKSPSGYVLMAVIDEKSLDREGRWPWPRSKIARLVDILSREGARVVGFDIGFFEPDENTNLKFLNFMENKLKKLNINNPSIVQFIEELKETSDHDLILARSIKESNSKVVLGYFFHMDRKSLPFKVGKEEIEEQLDRISHSRYPLVIYEDPEMKINPFFTAFIPEGNIPKINDAAPSSGYFNMFPDSDGIVRKMPLVIRCGEGLYMPLSLRCLWEFVDRPPTMVKVARYGMEGIKFGPIFIPTDENGQILINYLGPQKTFPHISITDILHGNYPEGLFRDKIVLVGATATGIYDLRNTPLDPVFPGLEIHATIVDNILTGNLLNKPRWTFIYDLLAIVILGLITGLIVSKVSPVKGIFFSFILFLIHILVARYLFVKYGLWVNMVYPLLTIVLIFITLSIYHYLVEERSKKFLRATFSTYLAPEVIEEMIKKESMPELGGEARIITAYFTDIESFSTFSEQLTAHHLVELLNEYLTKMTDILISEGGTLDKYEGDAIVAFLGAPMELPDHPLRACKVALKMQEALGELREKWKREKILPGEPVRNVKSLPPDIWAPEDRWPKIVHSMRMRIGINTGEIVVGNMGSTLRMNYTMMGDAVNLAARLEAAGKQYGIYTCVSEFTLLSEIPTDGAVKKVIDEFEVRFIDRITVVGKTEPVRIYELISKRGELTESEKRLLELFSEAQRHYLNMDWDRALEYFYQSKEYERFKDAKTTPSDVFIERCMQFKEEPPVLPGERWDGVYRLTKK